jgi:flotillin
MIALADGLSGGTLALIAGGILVILFIQGLIYASRFVKVGPNQALVISGTRRRVRRPDGRVEDVGFRVVTGGRTFVWPVLEKAETPSLECLGTRVSVPGAEASAHVRIRGDEASIAAAAQRFLSHTRTEIARIAGDILARHLRAALSGGPKGHAALEEETVSRASIDLAPLGLEVVSFTIQESRNGSGKG